MLELPPEKKNSYIYFGLRNDYLQKTSQGSVCGSLALHLKKMIFSKKKTSQASVGGFHWARHLKKMIFTKKNLPGVGLRFLGPLLEAGNFPTEEVLDGVAANMADTHLSIDVANLRFLQQERRHNYTTPKSFLELVSFYIEMLTVRQARVTENFERLEKGLTIMEQVQERVANLKEDLKTTMLQVEEKKTSTGALIEQVRLGKFSRNCF
jgi:hypothetical protein